MGRELWPRGSPVEAGAEPIVFAADLHLSPDAGPCRDRFCRFVGELPGGHLVLLGDLFHLYWGPEVLADPFWRPVLRALRSFAGRGGKAYFLPGNRDFHVGGEIRRRAGVECPGEAVRFRSGTKDLLACHGDQLCLKDVWYQRMKRIIRDAAARRAWRALPALLRRRLAMGLRFFTRRSLRKKEPPHLLPSPAALRSIFRRGADAVVSGHRHILGTTRFRVDGRPCLHLELPPWCDEGRVVVSREGILFSGRYVEGRGTGFTEEC
jgi:UDP-2,3-diacylglucosamine hydrolase